MEFFDVGERKIDLLAVTEQEANRADGSKQPTRKGRSSEEVSESCSPSAKRAVLIPRDKEGRSRPKRKKCKGDLDGNEASPARVVRRNILEGMSPSQKVAGDQPRREP